MTGIAADSVPEAFSRKPDPDEPWRYVSPCCRKAVTGSDTSLVGFGCTKCGKVHRKQELYDKKYDCIVNTRSIASD